MEGNLEEQKKQILYPNLLNILQRYQLFISQPIKYIFVFLLIQLSMILYFLVTSKQSNLAIKAVTILLYALLTIINVVFAVVDPGIIPKFKVQKKYDDIPLNYEQVRKNRNGGIFQKRQHNFIVKSHFLDVKYCGNCSIYRPPRTVHCYSCGACIEKLDHHCPWLGMCIGKRNYGLYLLFIILMQIMSSLLVAQTINFIIWRQFNDQRVQFVFNIILLIISALAAMFVFTLIVVHFKLSIQNLTTKEFYHGKWDLSSGNPFSKVFFVKNWNEIFNKGHPSKYRFQQNLQRGSLKQDDSLTKAQEDVNQLVSGEIKELKFDLNTITTPKEQRDRNFILRQSQHHIE